MLLLSAGCGGKYYVRSYPAGAKVYVRDLATNDKKLVGLSPLQINEESSLGDVFFLEFEKQNYKPKEVLVRVNSGESLAVTTRLDPVTPGSEGEGGGEDAKKDDQKPQPPEDKKKKPEELAKEIDDLKLRMALVENTVTFYKDAMFSARYVGNGQPKFDRDKNDKVVESLFKAQQMILGSKFEEAGKLIDDALEADEYVSNAWLLKGSLRYLQKDYKAARNAWERCLKLDPHNKTAYTYLAKVYEKLGVNGLPTAPAQMRYPASQVEIDKRAGESR
jgi:tetratricopeptide (TPR) repeat protein